jgi:GNAT superfamily N-acetyltransferase
VARYVGSTVRPDVAEVAVTVLDDWQGRGLGTLLLEVISERAREEGVTSFTALLLGTNTEMLNLLGRLERVRVIDRELGTVEVEVRLPEVGLAPALRKLLRISAENGIAVPPAERPSVRTG